MNRSLIVRVSFVILALSALGAAAKIAASQQLANSPKPSDRQSRHIVGEPRGRETL